MPVAAIAAATQVLPVFESVMALAGPSEVPGADSVSVGRTQVDRLLRVLPKPPSVSMNQLRLAAAIAGQDQVATPRCLRQLPGLALLLLRRAVNMPASLPVLTVIVLLLLLPPPSVATAQARLSPASSLHLSVDIPALDVSIVDGRPQELLLLSLDGLALEYHAGNSAGITYTQVSVAHVSAACCCFGDCCLFAHAAVLVRTALAGGRMQCAASLMHA